MGLGNYVKTVNKYSRRAAVVQTGWKTQSVSRAIFFLLLRARLHWRLERNGVSDILRG